VVSLLLCSVIRNVLGGAVSPASFAKIRFAASRRAVYWHLKPQDGDRSLLISSIAVSIVSSRLFFFSVILLYILLYCLLPYDASRQAGGKKLSEISDLARPRVRYRKSGGITRMSVIKGIEVSTELLSTRNRFAQRRLSSIFLHSDWTTSSNLFQPEVLCPRCESLRPRITKTADCVKTAHFRLRCEIQRSCPEKTLVPIRALSLCLAGGR